MKKISKKITVMFLGLCMTMLFSNGVVVASPGSNNAIVTESTQDTSILVSKTVTNEYDKYKELTSKSDQTLLQEGYSKEDLKKLRSIDYKAELKKRVVENAKLDDETLNKKGYTPEQIMQIRSYVGTEDQLQALSASLYLSTYVLSHSKSSSLSTANLRTDWTWTSAPILEMQDVVAAAWSEGMYLQSANSYATASYYNQSSDVYHHTETYSVTPNLNNGASVTFNVLSASYPGTYAKTGQFGTYVSKQSSVLELAVKTQYGHSTIFVRPSVSFSGTPGLSFSTGVTTEGTQDIYIPTM
ncbi:hypothetical protein UF75_0395 [Desulfosporosinus sp. I2]|uniref:hypothetical protein n=1 Tax=Desulfosporosinus sp. I2 TaxID=1617025 RepID=UPI0005EDD9D2|nr:hypothetical protein [Desulfosporosinus sp. I2]KJR49317.1 hypothetical protein UF75_0395 [Desulfosporosinus sp. I2]